MNIPWFCFFVNIFVLTDGLAESRKCLEAESDLTKYIWLITLSSTTWHSTIMLINCPECSTYILKVRPAFFAFVKANSVPFTGHDILKFDDVRTNIGNPYNASTGYFTAPKPGLYEISCLLYGFGTSAVTFQIHKNSQIFGYGYTPGRDYNSNTVSLLMELEKGDNVYVKHRSPSRKETVQGNQHAYFSGRLLQ